MMPVLARLDGARIEVWRLAGPMHSGAQGGCATAIAADCCSRPEHRRAGVRRPARCARLGPAPRHRGRLPRDVRCAEHARLPASAAHLELLVRDQRRDPDGERYWHFNGARQDAFIGVKRRSPATCRRPARWASPQPGPADGLLHRRRRGADRTGESAPVPRLGLSGAVRPAQPDVRARLHRARAAQTLFISGTASIVGYASAHAGDVREQTCETVRNIRAVLAAANQRLGVERFALERLSYKVYVRRSENLASIEQELRRAIGPLRTDAVPESRHLPPRPAGRDRSRRQLTCLLRHTPGWQSWEASPRCSRPRCAPRSNGRCGNSASA